MQELRNQQSTAEWVATGRDQLHRYLRTRLDCDEDAKDIAQETCLKMLQVSNLEEIRHPQAYLYRIATCSHGYSVYSGAINALNCPVLWHGMPHGFCIALNSELGQGDARC